MQKIDVADSMREATFVCHLPAGNGQVCGRVLRAGKARVFDLDVIREKITGHVATFEDLCSHAMCEPCAKIADENGFRTTWMLNAFRAITSYNLRVLEKEERDAARRREQSRQRNAEAEADWQAKNADRKARQQEEEERRSAAVNYFQQFRTPNHEVHRNFTPGNGGKELSASWKPGARRGGKREDRF